MLQEQIVLLTSTSLPKHVLLPQKSSTHGDIDSGMC